VQGHEGNRREWLQPDGVGGFASGTVGTIRTRRYHGLLLAATTPPTGRMMLVNGVDVWVVTPDGRFPLAAQHYDPGVVHPSGLDIASFTHRPWPRWVFRLPGEVEIVQDIAVVPLTGRTIVRWSLASPATDVLLEVRPLLSGRDYHGLQSENPGFEFATARTPEGLVWRPYPDVPAVIAATNGEWRDDPVWFRRFLYEEERARGLDAVEDLASPGVMTWNLKAEPAVWVLGTSDTVRLHPVPAAPAALAAFVDATLAARRAELETRPDVLDQAVDAYLVRRGAGRTIVAGYPWFTDWGRDTFIAVRGLCLATGRLDDARDILLEWSRTISEGMLPNRFPDGSGPPEFNAVDASLWFVVACWELLRAAGARPDVLSAHDRWQLEGAIVEVLDGCARGTRYGIRCDADGLLAAGEPGVQLTWMDARVDGRVITPRVGKPVEVQALWINALAAGADISARWPSLLARARAGFAQRFWNEEAGGLYDVVDVDHRPGSVDASIRPNQILAVGGLPVAALDGDRARRVVDLVERTLLTPLGLRSLAPSAPGYVPYYRGGPAERDAAYHQGTVWPWLLGPFVEAWVRVRGGGVDTQRDARRRFLAPLVAHLEEAGLGHISEVADAEPPHRPGGCPFQAWSLGELIRMDRRLAR
jgi:predicted glycogen debranching enzyme